ncbi:MAG: hypothetical protein ACR2LS_08305, partial [Thermomicrobiales bacterium]
MTATRSTLPTRRPRRKSKARTPPSRKWRSQAVDATKINRELNQLWSELTPPKPPGDPVPAAGGDGVVAPDLDLPDVPTQPVITRASTLNLVAVAHTPKEAERIQRGIIGLPDFQPSRVIVLVANRDSDGDTDDLLVRVQLLEQPPEQHRPTIRFECITVEA